MSPRDRSPVRTSSPRHPSGKDHWNQWSPYNLTLLQLEQTTGWSGQRGIQGAILKKNSIEKTIKCSVHSGLKYPNTDDEYTIGLHMFMKM